MTDPTKVPDMWWDMDDPERTYDSPEDWASYACPGAPKRVDFMTGYSGANRYCVIEPCAPKPDSGEIEYRIHAFDSRAEADAMAEDLRTALAKEKK